MADISKISLNGGEYNVRDKVAVLRGTGAPSTATIGSRGQLYEDTTNGDLYICKTVSGSSYVWEKKSQVTVTNADPGEGASLNAGEFLAVYGAGAYIDVADVIWSSFLDKIYPVGSIFMSATLSTASAVHNALGGTWVAWGAGRVPVGVNTSETEFNATEKIGGNKNMQTHSHTRGTMEITGSFKPQWADASGGGIILYDGNADGAFSISHSGTAFFTSATSASSSSSHNNKVSFKASNTWSGHTSEEGTGDSGNLQPYITCYMWKRTA